MSADKLFALKHCPFCGGEANGDGYSRYNRPLPDTTWADGSEITEAFFVNCIKCGVTNGRPGLVGGYQTKAEAIAAWNTRSHAELAREALTEWLFLLDSGQIKGNGLHAFAERSRALLSRARGEGGE